MSNAGTFTNRRWCHETYPIVIYMFEVSNGNTRKRCEIGSTFTERH